MDWIKTGECYESRRNIGRIFCLKEDQLTKYWLTIVPFFSQKHWRNFLENGMYQEYLELHAGQVEMVLLTTSKQWLKEDKFPLEKQYFGTTIHLGLGKMVLPYPTAGVYIWIDTPSEGARNWKGWSSKYHQDGWWSMDKTPTGKVHNRVEEGTGD